MSAKVLLIDDDADFRAAVKSLLESHGYHVLEASSGHEGLRMVVDHKPDAILLDIMMETTVEGYSVSHSLRYRDEYAEFRDIPIFMISSISESPDERFPTSMYTDLIRPDGYLTKPLDIPEFLGLLEKAVGATKGAAT
ncbi:MAG TPA: response regulator [Bryobacteraceae bacterium]|nr:response regulator [Bryobacteraceae bacterium]